MNRNLSKARFFVILAAIVLIGALFLPIWRIELDAPQYPEGLVLQIFANGLAGDVDIVNGLNHYIGMATLHTEDFVEFKVLPYIIGSLIVLGFLVGIINKRKLYYWYLGLFLVVAVVSMVDFYIWEYNYGHNLDPKAPIQVPGMAYQPPLIGFKQLLNFGAYSIPDTGGWLFIGSGLLTFVAFLFALSPNWLTKNKQQMVTACLLPFGFVVLSSCSADQQPIKYGTDNCDHCKMTIMDKRFGAEGVNKNGKAFKFDDLSCLAKFEKTGAVKEGLFYVATFDKNDGELFKADGLYFVQDDAFRSPMAGNVAAFSTEEAANNYAKSKNLPVMSWRMALEKF